MRASLHGVADAVDGDGSGDKRTKTLTRIHDGFQVCQRGRALSLRRDISDVGLRDWNNTVEDTCHAAHDDVDIDLFGCEADNAA